MDIAKALKKHREKVLEIARSHGALSVKVFGSVSKNAKNPKDLDLLVKISEETSLLELVAIKQDIEELLGCKVDVVTENSISPYLKEVILKEAVNL